jgi:hypothetical protein
MSKHIGRKQKWTEVGPTRYDGMFGYVEQNQHGRWDGFVVYRQRTSFESILLMRTPAALHESLRQFRKATKPVGEHKRAREAMMAVERMVEKMQAENNPDIVL